MGGLLQAIFAHDVESDGVAGFGFGFGDRGAGRNAARQVWDVCGLVVSGLFDDDGVAHRLEPNLFSPIRNILF